MKWPILISLAALTLNPVARGNDGLRDAITKDYHANLAELFVHFHRNPELSGLENKTASRLAEELRALGVEVTEGVGGTGLVGMIRNGDGPLVLVRPIQGARPGCKTGAVHGIGGSGNAQRARGSGLPHQPPGKPQTEKLELPEKNRRRNLCGVAHLFWYRKL